MSFSLWKIYEKKSEAREMLIRKSVISCDFISSSNCFSSERDFVTPATNTENATEVDWWKSLGNVELGKC